MVMVITKPKQTKQKRVWFWVITFISWFDCDFSSKLLEQS
jgi:hypothetical protein